MTAVLSAPNPAAPGGRALVYVLGVSHVSKRSLAHIEQLISLVRASTACPGARGDAPAGGRRPTIAPRTRGADALDKKKMGS